MKYRRYLRLRGRTYRDLEREVTDEVDAHLEMRVEELVRAGTDPARARATALEQFGDQSALLGAVQERERSLNRREWMETLVRDLRLAGRHARREPVVSVLSIATFALGIGLATAMFSVVDQVLLKPLPYDRSEELVALRGQDVNGRPIPWLSYSDWSDLHERNRTLSATAVHAARGVTLILGGRGRMFEGAHVSREYFDVLRMPFVAGRGFDAADAESGAVIVSDVLWRTHLGRAAPADMLLDVDGRMLPVVGVVPAELAYPESAEVWLLSRGEQRGGGPMRNNINWNTIARLAPGVTSDQAESDLADIAAGIRAADPAADYMHGVTVRDLRGLVVSGVRAPLILLFGAVCFVLLIGCSNVATLTLARAARRRPDIATRFALGASRAQVFRHLLTEQVALAFAGGVLGVVVAHACITLMKAATAVSVPRLQDAGLDLRILLFALGATVVSSLVAGWVPALRASAADPHSIMARRGVLAGRRHAAGATMLAVEVALATMLLIGGGLLVRSLARVVDRDIGFDVDGVAAAHVALTPSRFAEHPAAAPQFWQQLLERLNPDPSVASASLANWVPTATGGTTYLEVEGVDGMDETGVAYRVVSDDYFTTMRMSILRGRSFGTTDAATGERVAIINELLAERYWPGRDPIGERIRTPGMEGYDNVQWLRIVGVTSNVRHGGHESQATAHVYVLQRQRPEHRAMHVLARTRDGNSAEAVRVLEGAVSSLAPELAVNARDLEGELASLTAERRLLTGVLNVFAVLALLLAAIGVFGLFSYSIAQRTQEFGVRCALGADRARIVRLVLGDALRLVVAGCVAGVIGAFWLTRLLRSQLADVTNTDPITYATAFLVITLAALVAAAVPGLRASRVDPQTALRSV